MEKIEQELKELRLKIASLQKQINTSNNLFGKPSKELGTTSSDTVICTSGNLKIRYGSKYVTIFKDGKLVTDSEKFLKVVSKLGEKDGLYVIIPKSDETSEDNQEGSTYSNPDNQSYINNSNQIILKAKGIGYNLNIPSGTIVPFYGNVIPEGWVLCDGKSYNSSYELLTGDYSSDSVFFTAPDLTGKILMQFEQESSPNLNLNTSSEDPEANILYNIKYIIKL